MDTKKIGEFITRMRKSKGLTQTELAEKLKVSNKAVSKWETGKGMPDVSLLKPLSHILEVTINDLLNGEIGNENSKMMQLDTNIEALIKMMERLNRNKNTIIGSLILVFGLVLTGIGRIEMASDFGNFINGLATGLSVGAMLVGIITIVYNQAKSTGEKDVK